ncbi:MAG: macro domain-containing protein [Candidatus Bathyarchaeota archaeon]|nr:macro domain-containing protein [Candidatus Bathyarchaeota archaeon]
MTEPEHTYKDVNVTARKGDITQLEVDAIVNAANSLLVMGGGVAGAILKTGGREIQEEALRHAPIPVGNAVATRAGALKAKYIIHAPTMKRPAMRIGRENVGLATRGALECAKQLKIGSVAFPGMGTGVGGLRPQEATHIMIQEIKRHIDKGTTLNRIILVGFTKDLVLAFKKALRSLQ